jgi:hypothetical protein
LLRGEPPDLLAPAPGFGAVLCVEVQDAANCERTTHSTTTLQAPSTSPV